MTSPRVSKPVFQAIETRTACSMVFPRLREEDARFFLVGARTVPARGDSHGWQVCLQKLARNISLPGPESQVSQPGSRSPKPGFCKGYRNVTVTDRGHRTVTGARFMSMISINHHDWSALEQEFYRRAGAAGIEPGTLSWYGFSFELPVHEDPRHEFLGTGFGQRCAETIDQILKGAI